MAYEICNLSESEKIRRLYCGSPNWYDQRCSTSRIYLHPGFISITTKEHIHIHAIFDAINEVFNRHGVKL